MISDAVLPDGRGLELISDFLDEEPKLPVLMITGYLEEWDRQEKNMNLPLLQKPFAVADLLEKVSQLLKNH